MWHYICLVVGADRFGVGQMIIEYNAWRDKLYVITEADYTARGGTN